jgi:hypothetical protein
LYVHSPLLSLSLSFILFFLSLKQLFCQLRESTTGTFPNLLSAEKILNSENFITPGETSLYVAFLTLTRVHQICGNNGQVSLVELGYPFRPQPPLTLGVAPLLLSCGLVRRLEVVSNSKLPT